MSDQAATALPSPAPSTTPTEHRGWALKMIFWSAALAAFLLGGAWCAANWKVFHLAYCKHLIYSNDEWTQTSGLDKLGKVHFNASMSKEVVLNAMSRLGLKTAPFPSKIYGADEARVIFFDGPERRRFPFWAWVIFNQGHYVGIRTCH